MSAVSIIAHEELLEMLECCADPQEILKHLPRWETVERIHYLVEGYQQGTLTPLEVTELECILEVVPAIYQRMKAGKVIEI